MLKLISLYEPPLLVKRVGRPENPRHRCNRSTGTELRNTVIAAEVESYGLRHTFLHGIIKIICERVKIQAASFEGT